MQSKKDNGDAVSSAGRASGIPRWVKMFGFIGLFLLVLIVILHLTGHGMGAHNHGMQLP